MTTKLNELFLNRASVLRDSMKQGITESNFYCKNVRKAEWPKPQGTQYSCPVYERTIVPDSADLYSSAEKKVPNFGITVRQVHLRKSAVHSPDICLDDLREVWQVDDTLKQTARVMEENAKWIWSNAFQNDILENCENHVLTRGVTELLLQQSKNIADENGNQQTLTLVRSFSRDSAPIVPGMERESVQFPPRINFWGKRVYPYISDKVEKGNRWLVNPKYKKAAEQMIVFHPDICEFVFPDLENWIGEVMYRNIPSADYNPEGNIGFFRMLFSYGVKPIRPDLGTVITVLPPGLKGWLWYWAWKLVGFKP